jgi:hypothetical protein
MKKLLLVVLVLMAGSVQADELDQPMCKVRICNKIERFTLSIGNMISDQLGETCSDIIMPKAEAVPGKVLSSESRWYQGSHINPTKKSVTRVDSIIKCQDAK